MSLGTLTVRETMLMLLHCLCNNAQFCGVPMKETCVLLNVFTEVITKIYLLNSTF